MTKDRQTKERYSKVSRRIWNDAVFLELTASKPCAQTLWFRLLTGPELTAIPGLFQAYDVQLAAALRWPIKAFRKAFDELSSKGLAKADWSKGLVWVPKAIRHNEPQSTNVIKSWVMVHGELPECDLKTEAMASIKAHIGTMPQAFQQAFQQAFSGESGKPSGVSSTKSYGIQEQEQEQEQDPPNPPPGDFRLPRDWDPSASVFVGTSVPEWAHPELLSRFRSYHCNGDKSRSATDWVQSYARWACGEWAKNPPQKPPELTEADTARDAAQRREETRLRGEALAAEKRRLYAARATETGVSRSAEELVRSLRGGGN